MKKILCSITIALCIVAMVSTAFANPLLQIYSSDSFMVFPLTGWELQREEAYSQIVKISNGNTVGQMTFYEVPLEGVSFDDAVVDYNNLYLEYITSALGEHPTILAENEMDFYDYTVKYTICEESINGQKTQVGYALVPGEEAVMILQIIWPEIPVLESKIDILLPCVMPNE